MQMRTRRKTKMRKKNEDRNSKKEEWEKPESGQK